MGYHAPFMVNGGRGSSPLTYHAPFMVNGGRGSSPLPMPRPFHDVNQCNKKNISNDLYCCFFCLICFYMTIDYYYYLTVLDKKYAKIFHEELLSRRRKKPKIIHENDAIQSENSPMLFIQKIILSQE